jgi:hypothetical protein
MSPHPPPSKPGANPVEDDFDWPPPHDDLSVHDLDGAPWSHLQAASNEAFAHRHGEPAPPRPAPRPSRLQLGLVITVSAAMTFAAAWAMREMRHPISLITGPAPAATSTLVAAAEAPAPPPLTIIATYPVVENRGDRLQDDRTNADPDRVQVQPAAAVAEVAPQTAVLDEPRHAASSTSEVPLVTAGPAIDDPMTTAALVADAVPAPAAAPTAPWSARADADIRDLLQRYEAAYDRRDVATAAALWPTLDQRALSRAFASLDRQDVSFEHCRIDASERRGSAVCVGTVRYVPRVGRGVEKEGRITWTFDLARSGEDWRITRLNAR